MAAPSVGGPVPGLGYGKPVRPHQLLRVTPEGVVPAQAVVAEEVPVAFVYNGRSYAVMMCTPADLEDLAVGFSVSEEIVRRASDVSRIEVVRHSRGIELQLIIPDAAAEQLALRSRAISGRTGCGLCGVEAIDDAIRSTHTVSAPLELLPDALWRAGSELSDRQPYNRETNAVHAAAWATADGALREVREDVGRHNALDKVIGALTRGGTDASDGFIVVTSRASYELVQKAAIAGVSILAAVSRPTSLAVRMADACGMTLVGLLRGTSANVYSHPRRLGIPEQGAGNLYSDWR